MSIINDNPITVESQKIVYDKYWMRELSINSAFGFTQVAKAILMPYSTEGSVVAEDPVEITIDDLEAFAAENPKVAQAIGLLFEVFTEIVNEQNPTENPTEANPTEGN